MAYPPVVDHSDILPLLAGLDPWLQQAAESGAEYNSQKINSLVPQWTRRFEREVQFRINPVQVVSNPQQNDGYYAPINSQTGVSMDNTNTYEVVVESGYPYFAHEAWEYLKVQLNERPVQQIQRVRLMLGNSVAYSFPSEWIFVDQRSGLFSLIPAVGAASVVNAAIAFATLQISFGQRDYLPMAICFDYIAGLPTGWQFTSEYSDYRRILCEYCALKILEDIQYVYDPGVASKGISTGGASQNVQYDRFMNRKAELTKSVNDFKAELQGQETPIHFGLV